MRIFILLLVSMFYIGCSSLGPIEGKASALATSEITVVNPTDIDVMLINNTAKDTMFISQHDSLKIKASIGDTLSSLSSMLIVAGDVSWTIAIDPYFWVTLIYESSSVPLKIWKRSLDTDPIYCWTPFQINANKGDTLFSNIGGVLDTAVIIENYIWKF